MTILLLNIRPGWLFPVKQQFQVASASKVVYQKNVVNRSPWQDGCRSQQQFGWIHVDVGLRVSHKNKTYSKRVQENSINQRYNTPAKFKDGANSLLRLRTAEPLRCAQCCPLLTESYITTVSNNVQCCCAICTHYQAGAEPDWKN